MNDDQNHTRAAPVTDICRTTRWTLVMASNGATPDARAALSELCELYYHPVIRFLRSEGRTEELSRELTQDFFTRILRGSGFGTADPGKGRFRSYLWGCLRHFLADRRKSEQRLKRGGGILPESLDGGGAQEESEEDPQLAKDPNLTPDAAFDREWALSILNRSLETLQGDYLKDGRGKQFDVLKPWLMGNPPDSSQQEAARRLGQNEGAVKVAVHRLRRRLREILRAEIAQTLRDPGQIDEELRSLVAALRG